MARLSDKQLLKLVGIVSRGSVTQCVAISSDLPSHKRFGLMQSAVHKGPMTLAEKLREVKKAKLDEGPQAD